MPKTSTQEAFAAARSYHPNDLSYTVFLEKYSRWRDDLGRRETWPETVQRAVDFLKELVRDYGMPLDDMTWSNIHNAILTMQVLPSMRLLAMAGEAARRSHITLYNCAYTPIDSLDSFVEALIISMSGTGFGYSVEEKYINKLPVVLPQKGVPKLSFLVQDSSEGWAEALSTGLRTWFNGYDIDFDYSLIRPSGSVLRTKGGRASGPAPLSNMLSFARTTILGKQGSKLSSLNAHDILGNIAMGAVSGGHRRCLPIGTRIPTKRGMLPIEDVVVGDSVVTERGYKSVTGVMEQGVQNLVRIHTESGTYLDCTPNHRVAVLSSALGDYEFKEAQNLIGGDRLLFVPMEGDGVDAPLPALPEFFPHDSKRVCIGQPNLTTEFAWFLGKFFADGHVQVQGNRVRASVSCATSEPDQIARIVAYLETLGVSKTVRKGEGNWVVIQINAAQFSRWLSTVKVSKEPLQIPEYIWRASVPIRSAFLAGVMDGDGSFGARPVTVVSTVYENFGREIVRLLASLGVVSELRKISSNRPDSWQQLWNVSIKDARTLRIAEEVIGSYACTEWVPRHQSQNGYTVPRNMIVRDLPRNMYSSRYSSQRPRGMNSSAWADITGVTNMVPVAVVSVEPLDNALETFDLEVQDGAVFSAEGYLVHNSAMISLYSWNDKAMRHCKDGEFWNESPWRTTANNSAVLDSSSISDLDLRQHFQSMVAGGNGEPGIFSRLAARSMRPDRRADSDFGTNPCAEISLRPQEFCNLTEVILRPKDFKSSIMAKTAIAALIGTIQSLATNFPGLRSTWAENCPEERLLGVGFTGQMDCPAFRDPFIMRACQEQARVYNEFYASHFRIPQSASITCVKPSGSTSVLVNSSSGLHPRWSPLYLKNVRLMGTGPVAKTLLMNNFPMSPENGQAWDNYDTLVAHFPVESPKNSVYRDDLTALQQLEYWKSVKLNLTEHNPSVTITYRPDEVEIVEDWIVSNRSILGGQAYLPHFEEDVSLKQMPYQERTPQEFERDVAAVPKDIDFSLITEIEQSDQTTSAQELACSAGLCEV